jgi:hypothetical protein
MRMRGVEVGGIAVGEAIIVGEAVGLEVQPVKISMIQRVMKIIRFMIRLPSGHESAQHFYPAQRQACG